MARPGHCKRLESPGLACRPLCSAKGARPPCTTPSGTQSTLSMFAKLVSKASPTWKQNKGSGDFWVSSRPPLWPPCLTQPLGGKVEKPCVGAENPTRGRCLCLQPLSNLTRNPSPALLLLYFFSLSTLMSSVNFENVRPYCSPKLNSKVKKRKSKSGGLF